MSASFTIRPAAASDQRTIRQIVWAARLNPSGLRWQRFLVAEQDARVIGIGQVKPHHDGSRELASLAVVLDQQGQGVGAALLRALLARESGTLHLMCAGYNESYYLRFGFRPVAPGELPPYFRRVARLARAASAAAALAGMQAQLVVMRRDGDRKV